MASEILAVSPSNSVAAKTSSDLANEAQALGFMVSDAVDIRGALTLIDRPARVLICGSLYLAGEALQLNNWVPD